MKTMQDFPSVVGLGEIGVLKSMEETGGFFRKVFSLVRQEKSSDPSFPTIWIN